MRRHVREVQGRRRTRNACVPVLTIEIMIGRCFIYVVAGMCTLEGRSGGTN